MNTNPSKEDCIAIRCKGCHRLKYAVVNEARVMTSERFKEIGEFVSKGDTVEHMTPERVRKSAFGCKCKPV